VELVDHALVVGGSGMLRDVVVRLASRYATVSVVARTPDRLDAVKAAAAPRSDRVNTIAIDYRDRDAFRAQLLDARGRFGRYAVAVGWIRSSATAARDIVLELMNVGPDIARYFDVVGSTGRHPAAVSVERLRRYEGLPFVGYRTIVLGFVAECGRSRWLSDKEISDGVMHAVTTDALSSVVGELEPWTARP
jgi:hypothetical protein